jgi:hypothetical protein
MTPDEILRLRNALQSFSNQLASHPVVYAVMTFGMRVKTMQKFTSDPGKLDESLEKIARDSPNGLSTHTYDAVDDAIRMLVRSAPRTREKRLMKRAVLVVTDGFPVGDTVAPQDCDRTGQRGGRECVCRDAAVVFARDGVVSANTAADAARRQWTGGIDWRSQCLRERERLRAVVSRSGGRSEFRICAGLLSARGKETRWASAHDQSRGTAGINFKTKPL